MIFTVVWLPAAQQRLAELWLQASDRRGITDAANAIDRRLRTDADSAGQPFFEGRVLVVPPLVVTFRVSLDDRLVSVMEVQMVS